LPNLIARALFIINQSINQDSTLRSECVIHISIIEKSQTLTIIGATATETITITIRIK